MLLVSVLEFSSLAINTNPHTPLLHSRNVTLPNLDRDSTSPRFPMPPPVDIPQRVRSPEPASPTISTDYHSVVREYWCSLRRRLPALQPTMKQLRQHPLRPRRSHLVYAPTPLRARKSVVIWHLPMLNMCRW